MTASATPAPRISYLVKWVERGLRVRLDAVLAAHGLTTPEYTALSVLRARDGLSSAQLARRTLVSAQAMNQVVISLEGRRLIARVIDPAHGRVQRISLTAKGRRLLEDCDEATAPIEEQLLSSLGRQERLALRRGLEACVAALADVSEETEEAGRRRVRSRPSGDAQERTNR